MGTPIPGRASPNERAGPTAAESAVMLALLAVVLCRTAGAFLLRERQRADAQKTFDARPIRIGEPAPAGTK